MIKVNGMKRIFEHIDLVLLPDLVILKNLKLYSKITSRLLKLYNFTPLLLTSGLDFHLSNRSPRAALGVR